MHKIFKNDLTEIPEEPHVQTKRVRRPKIEISLTHHELAQVQAVASPLKLATFAKLVLMAHVHGAKLELPKAPPQYPKVNQETVAKLGKFLNSAANNINQLTRYCHTNKGIRQEDLETLIKLVRTMDVGVHKALLDPLPEKANERKQ